MSSYQQPFNYFAERSSQLRNAESQAKINTYWCYLSLLKTNLWQHDYYSSKEANMLKQIGYQIPTIKGGGPDMDRFIRFIEQKTNVKSVVTNRLKRLKRKSLNSAVRIPGETEFIDLQRVFNVAGIWSSKKAQKPRKLPTFIQPYAN